MGDRRVFLIASVLVLGCAEERVSTGDGAAKRLDAEQGQQTDTGLVCDETSRSIEFEDDIPLGFSAQAVADWATAERISRIAWADGNTAEVTLSIDTSSRSVTLVESTSPKSSTINCASRLELYVKLGLRTDDGRLSETLDFLLNATTEDVAFGSVAVNAEALVGRLDTSQTSGRLTISVNLSANEFSGSIAEQIETEEDTGVSLQRTVLGEW